MVRIQYRYGGLKRRIAVDATPMEAARLASLLPDGEVLLPVPRNPEQAAVLAVLTTRAELKRIAETTK